MKNINKKILVVAAHPDDEILGCGGTLIKFRKKGYKIKCIFFADGESSRNFKNKNKLLTNIQKREKQALNVSKLLSFEQPCFFRFPDNKLDTIPLLKIINIIEKEINDFRPSIIFTHSQADLNVDHSLLCKAVLTSTRPFSKTYVKRVLCFEVSSNSELYFSNNKSFFKPNLFSDVSKEIKLKLKALKIYKNEIRRHPHPRSIKSLKNLAMYRGGQSGFNYVEAFEIIRDII